ncbi:2OG-Fe(II) oxygenase [Micromonospora sp. DR5-3]|uniref:2OG-Fe(II) oxygenase n=1 Tax=unclassified Micromonospora TaxID=2617518 RepID=UPI0011DB75C1|nr:MULTISPECIES: 2OG-Fe(II) oxygenase [unclassified Micromonospora]MCW3818993.1 2OG-Fe(II) oxygenase [Micromonospora sp. DR5-3]TYC21006.1 hypothetical protein FXF52_28190 [Micromonospora sp. MP36]
MTDSSQSAFFGARNEATRIEIFDELSNLAQAALRTFFRRMGAPHLMDEVVLPLLGEGDSQIFAAVRDRPWPPWGLGARNVVAVLQTHLVADGCWGLSPVYVADEDLTNVALTAALYKEALETLAVDPNAEVHYLVADGSLHADHVLTQTGFERTEDVFLTEAARYFTYRIPAGALLEKLGLAKVDTGDLLAQVVDREVYARNATFHHTVYLGSRAEWTIDRVDVASEIARLVRGGHYSKPGGVPTGTGRYSFDERFEDIVQPVREFLDVEQHLGLYQHVLEEREKFEVATIVPRGAVEPTVNERIRRSRTLDDLGPYGDRLVERIREQLGEVLPRLKHPAFQLGEIELQATVNGDGDYFRLHRDSDGTDTRELTFVYFFFPEPRRFSGGELRVFETRDVDGQLIPTDRSQTIVPRGNLAVFFPSRHEHEVLPVRVPSGTLEDARFSVTGWIHRK